MRTSHRFHEPGLTPRTTSSEAIAVAVSAAASQLLGTMVTSWFSRGAGRHLRKQAFGAVCCSLVDAHLVRVGLGLRD